MMLQSGFWVSDKMACGTYYIGTEVTANSVDEGTKI